MSVLKLGLASKLMPKKKKAYSEKYLQNYANQIRLENEPEELEALETKQLNASLLMEEGIGVKDRALIELNTPDVEDDEEEDELDTGLIL